MSPDQPLLNIEFRILHTAPADYPLTYRLRAFSLAHISSLFLSTADPSHPRPQKPSGHPWRSGAAGRIDPVVRDRMQYEGRDRQDGLHPEGGTGMKLLFEKSVPGTGGCYIPSCDVEAYTLSSSYLREKEAELPEISENDLSRHYSALERRKRAHYRNRKRG